MPRLSTGFIIVGAYADKVRRTLFAQLAQRARQDKEWAQKVAFGAAQLNRVLYELFVNRLRLDKGDVVRVRIDYDIDEGAKEIVWKWGTLQVEVFRRVQDEGITAAVKEVAASAAEIVKGAVRFELSKLGETEDGDVIYSVVLNGREVGAVEVTPLNGEVLLKSGAILEPSPVTVQRARLKLEGRSAEEVVAQAISRPMEARQVDRDEALRVINSLRSRVSAKPMEEGAEEGEGLA